MRTRKKQKNDYSKLERKVITQMFLILLAATALVIFLRELVRGHFATWFVEFLENTFFLSDRDAYTVYNFTLKKNMLPIGIVSIIICMIILSRFAVSRFSNFFNEISAGLNRLVEESAEEITLSPELDTMEKKLNQVRLALERKTRDAKAAEQRKNDLVVYLAHDIKTPLTSVIGYLSLLDEAPDMPAEQRAKYIGITLEKAYRLEELINEFFEITRFNLESIVLNKGKINLSMMLQQMADEFYPMLTPQGKQAVVHAPEDLTLSGDADKLARVFNNILKNAIAYSYENSVIDISAVRQGDNAVITFTNKGNPIPPQKLDTIFEKFYRLDSSRSTNTGGAGLGLAIAKEIVTAHGGTITAKSDPEHTVFTVKLPS